MIAHPERDIDGTSTTFIVDLWTRKLLGLRYQDDRPGMVWFDAEWATMQKSVDRVLPDTVNLLQRRGDRWIVIAVSDRNPGDVYLLDGKTLKMQTIASWRNT